MNRPPPRAGLISPGQVAEQLGVHRRTVARWTDEGRLPALVLPSGHRRYRQQDVDAVLRAYEPAGGSRDEAPGPARVGAA